MVDAASILVTTRDGAVLVGERSKQILFLGGYCAFPGGGLEEADRQAGARMGIDPLICCALREMIEETGVVIDGAIVRAVHPEERGRPLEELSVSIDASRFEPAGRWKTPDYSPAQFDTRFFVVEVQATCEATPDPREFAWARFERASSWLDRWRRFEIVLVPPTLLGLEALAHGSNGAAARLRAIDAASWIDFEPLSGIRQLPLRTPTLPPAEHTNAHVIGHERLLIVDPATYDPNERQVLLSLIEQIGKDVQAILLTHHHRDHVGAANWLRREIGCPVLAHPVTRDLLEEKISIDDVIEEGARIDLGKDRAGNDLVLGALFTPGHAPGHLVLEDLRPNARALIVGDMVAAIGTIIVDPSDGDMAEYLRQLRRLRALPEKILFPAHGPPILEGHAKLDHYVTHRLMREAKVFAALEATPGATAWDLLTLAYDDTPKEIWPLAERSCLAHLIKLVSDGRAARNGDRFRSI
jgi:endoribonuclease LACTB2